MQMTNRKKFSWIDKELSGILNWRNRVEPEIIKPAQLPLLDLPDSGGSWENFNFRGYVEMFCLTEERRGKAKAIGIEYEQPLIDIVPKEHKPRLFTELEKFRRELDSLDIAYLETGPLMFRLRACCNPETIYAVHLLPLIPSSENINHDRGAFDFDGWLRPDPRSFQLLLAALRNGLLHAPKQQCPNHEYMYLKEYSMDAENSASVFGQGDPLLRFHINTRKLQESRNIFTDYEGMDVQEEYGRTYLVKGGIPVNCIDGWDIWEDDAPPPNKKRP